MRDYTTEQQKKKAIIQTIKNLYDTLLLYFNEDEIIKAILSFKLLDDRVGCTKDYNNFVNIIVCTKVNIDDEIISIPMQTGYFIPLDWITSAFKVRKIDDQQFISDIDITDYTKINL